MEDSFKPESTFTLLTIFFWSDTTKFKKGSMKNFEFSVFLKNFNDCSKFKTGRNLLKL